MQSASHILMVRPAAFAYNEQTAVNNAFQSKDDNTDINQRAQEEFDTFVHQLKKNNIDVTVMQDSLEPLTPDAVFPNNWVSFHYTGHIILYPMFAQNRRLERNKGILEQISQQFIIRSSVDLTEYENESRFLEGTGSMVLDREHQIAYACLSARTDATVIYDFCEILNFTPILFYASDENNIPVYHTNVMMSIADEYAIICLESIQNDVQKKVVTDSLLANGKEIIPLSFEQLHLFAGNVLQVKNIKGERFLVMSTQAYKAFTEEQLNTIRRYNPIIHAPLYTIEKNGGGSARCMMAEIFLEEKRNQDKESPTPSANDSGL